MARTTTFSKQHPFSTKSTIRHAEELLLKMVKLLTSLLGLTKLCLPILAMELSPSPSPPADTDLICPSDNLSECYPRLFQPTKDFQIIKAGQDIPPGLHVRMNIWSGEREARLNIPMEGEDGEAVIEVPLEQAVVVIPQPDKGTEEIPSLRDQASKQPPVYDAAGKIQPPRDPDGSPSDSSTFHNAIQIIKSSPFVESLSSALEDLSELSHDIYYGVELAKDSTLLEKLLCITTSLDTSLHDQKAALILGHAVQNNPTALNEVAKSWSQLFHPQCRNRGSGYDLISMLRESLSHGPPMATVKAQVYALTGLIKNPVIRHEFLKKGGMQFLLAVFLQDGGEEWEIVQVKVAQLVMDNFLDESMGAELGVWPKTVMQSSESAWCGSEERRFDDTCWSYHVSKSAPNNGKEWKREFLSALERSRTKEGEEREHREL